MAAHATLVGFVGVAILLAAFFLSLSRCVRADGAIYLALNLVGAALAGWSSYLIEFLPFVLLEGAWAIVAAIALARRIFTMIGRRGDRRIAPV